MKLASLLLILLLSACQSTRPTISSSPANPAMDNVTEYALSLTGTPYKYGGTSPDSGFDCSGFVGHVYKHALGKSLPRSSEAISRVGANPKPGSLRPGDLVFYNTLHKPYSHVGIYLGDGQFIHSPSRGKSVSVVNMNEDYWRARYNGARRLKP